MPDPEMRLLEHPRFRQVQLDIFTRTLVGDCMSHACRTIEPDRERLDACCQYGADVDLTERDAILAHGDELRALLTPAAARAPWFTDEIVDDPDFPTGRHVRTARHDDGCVFLSHEGRGCAIHRASIEGGWDFHGIKPHVCRLFPLTYDDDSILISDDYIDYSCAFLPDAPTLYEVQRETLRAVFGEALVTELDRVAATIPRRRSPSLPTVP